MGHALRSISATSLSLFRKLEKPKKRKSGEVKIKTLAISSIGTTFIVVKCSKSDRHFNGGVSMYSRSIDRPPFVRKLFLEDVAAAVGTALVLISSVQDLQTQADRLNQVSVRRRRRNGENAACLVY